MTTTKPSLTYCVVCYLHGICPSIWFNVQLDCVIAAYMYICISWSIIIDLPLPCYLIHGFLGLQSAPATCTLAACNCDSRHLQFPFSDFHSRWHYGTSTQRGPYILPSIAQESTQSYSQNSSRVWLAADKLCLATEGRESTGSRVWLVADRLSLAPEGRESTASFPHPSGNQCHDSLFCPCPESYLSL